MGANAAKCCAGCCAKMTKPFIRETDTEYDANLKRVLLPVAYVLTPVHIYYFLRVVLNLQDEHPLFTVQSFLGMATVVYFFVAGAVGARMGPVLDVFLLGCAVYNIMFDMYLSADGSQGPWALVVLILDCALVFDRPKVVPPILVLTTAWLWFNSTERTFRWGLYDALEEQPVPETCMCANPPCEGTVSTLLTGMIIVSLILYVDFYLTRGFSNGLRRQLRRMEASVQAAADVTAALAKYDVDAAEKAISSGDDLPEELSKLFMQLLSNLRSYKVYLPHSCLVVDDPEDTSGKEHQRPSAESTGSARSTRSWSSPHGSLTRAMSLTSSRGSVQMDTHTPRHNDKVGTTGPINLVAAPRRSRVSIAAANAIGYLASSSSAELHKQSNKDWIASDVESWCAAVAEASGLVDFIGGDKRYASFNARRQCSDHGSKAMSVLSSRGQGAMSGFSGCVATGQAVSGDFGSSSMLRFMILGVLPCWVHCLERIAARWQVHVLADGEAYSGACFEWEGELLCAGLFAKRGATPLRLYRMNSEKRHRSRQEVAEWMYELENIGQGKYEETNTKMAGLIKVKFEEMGQVTTEEVAAEELGEEGSVLWKVAEVGMVQV